jgi:hypothetical protein
MHKPISLSKWDKQKNWHTPVAKKKYGRILTSESNHRTCQWIIVVTLKGEHCPLLYWSQNLLLHTTLTRDRIGWSFRLRCSRYKLGLFLSDKILNEYLPRTIWGPDLKASNKYKSEFLEFANNSKRKMAYNLSPITNKRGNASCVILQAG